MNKKAATGKKIRISTIEKLGEVLIHLGEAAVFGGGATFFIQGLVRWGVSLIGVVGGILLIFSGLYIHNNAEKYGV